MPTYHIHIKGLVQGVGFRPHVYRIAKEMDVKGWVNNSTNGVHIMAAAEEETLEKFYQEIIQHPPANAKITYAHAALVSPQAFDEFHIQVSEHTKQPDLLITPDFGLCAICREELFDPSNRRYHYPFITCTQCGPRYSIITALPYDRPQTTMAPYDQCWQCREEYHNPGNKRYYSQTNSCPDCGIPMFLYNADGECISEDYEGIIMMVQEALAKGHTVAVKGIGGFLLMCDATNHLAISALRDNKHRPSKPLALLYSDTNTVLKDVMLQEKEQDLLQSVTAPIVLCTLKESPQTGICTEVIAPGLSKIGIMLPYAPLLALIASNFGKPVVATSGNLSGSPILFTDNEALTGLTGIADFFLTYEREIVVPQDDSVIQFSPGHQQKIILRRSRGLAPNYFSSPFMENSPAVLAMGAELKSSFALQYDTHCYVSQFLGDQENFEAQQSYSHTLRHLTGLLQFEPEVVLVDKHPGYFVTQAGKELAEQHHLPLYEVQHHKAHFCAVLAENNVLDSEKPILGVIWDGTGYGEDKQIWGGEFFRYDTTGINRIAHLDYFPVIAGDKMAREPRLSALALTGNYPAASPFLRDKFSTQEWNYYQQLLLKNNLIQTSSMGRLLDGLASLLDVCNHGSYEGEAAMKLEALAITCQRIPEDDYDLAMADNLIQWQGMTHQIIRDLMAKVDKSVIAYKIHRSLAKLVRTVAEKSAMTTIAFSGGVMQNALLTDLLIDELKAYHLLFHQQLSPNDECIGFGQLAYMQIKHAELPTFQEEKIEMFT